MKIIFTDELDQIMRHGRGTTIAVPDRPWFWQISADHVLHAEGFEPTLKDAMEAAQIHDPRNTMCCGTASLSEGTRHSGECVG